VRTVLADVTPRTIILLDDGRVGFYCYRYVADDGRALGRVLVQEKPGRVETRDVDVLATVDLIWCDRQAQQALWERLVAEAGETLTRTGDGYLVPPGSGVWLDAGPVRLRVEREVGGVRVGAYGCGGSSAGMPIRAFHVLDGEV
jgi:hypothetical protein